MDQPPGSWQLIEWLVGGLIALLQVIFGYQIHRIGKLEDGKADKADLRDLIDEIKEDRKAADESRGALHEKVNDVALSIARLEGSKR